MTIKDGATSLEKPLPRNANAMVVVAKTAATLWVAGKDSLAIVRSELRRERRQQYLHFIKQVGTQLHTLAAPCGRDDLCEASAGMEFVDVGAW
jgi:hypothetical protein